MVIALPRRGNDQRLPGKLYLRLLPKHAKIAILDLDAATIRQRRPDLQSDKRLEKRLTLYRQLAAELSLTIVSSQLPIEEVNKTLRRIMELDYGS